MALTIEEQKEFKALEGMSPAKESPSVGLSATEELEMKYLESLGSDEVNGSGGVGGIEARPLTPTEIAEQEKLEIYNKMIRSGEIKPTKTLKSKAGEMVGRLGAESVGAYGFAKAAGKLPIQSPRLKGLVVLGASGLGAGLASMGYTGYEQTFTKRGKEMSLGEIYNEQAIDGIKSAAAEVTGRVGMKFIGKTLRPVAKKLVPGAKKVSREFLKRGAVLTPAQATESRILDTLESIAEGSFAGGGKLQWLKRITQPQALGSYVDDVSKQIGKGVRSNLSPEEVGDLIQSTISGKRTIFKSTAKAAYGKVDDLAKGVIVDLKPLKAYASGQLKKAATRKGIGSTQAGDALLKKVMMLDDTISFKNAQGLRSALLDEKGAMSITKDKALGLASKLIGLTDNVMESGGGKLAPEAKNAWRVANKFYRTGSERFNKKIIKNLVKTLDENPEIAVKKIFRPNASRQIKAVKDLMTPSSWRNVKSAYFEDLLQKSADADGVVSGNKFLGILNGMGDDTLKSIYTQEELLNIKTVGKMAQLIQKPTGGGGKMLIQLAQPGALLNIMQGGSLQGTSATIVAAPYVISRIFSSKTGSKLLSTGMKTPIGSEAAAGLTTRILAEIAKTKMEIKKEKAGNKIPTEL